MILRLLLSGLRVSIHAPARGATVLIICMLHDYVKTLDESRGDDIQYQAYYRDKFIKIADKLAEQIEYDYDKAVEKCRKKQLKEERDSDIGEDGLSQLVKKRRSKHGQRRRNKKRESETTSV